jgi:hypothetical protein
LPLEGEEIAEKKDVGGARNDTKVEVRGVSPLLQKEEPEDWQTQESWHL